MSTELIPVCVGACLCPGTPHADGDFVYLRPKLAWRHVTAIKWEILELKEESVDMPAGEVMGILSEGYLLHGVAEWNLLTLGAKDKAEQLPVTRETIQSEILEDIERASIVSEMADSLYGPQVLLPLARRGRLSSAAMPIKSSTSATNGSSVKPQKRSKRSSTTTSPMVATETTTS